MKGEMMGDAPMTNPVVETTPNSVPVVPDDWAALGMKAGYDPKIAEALRLFIVGPSGEGKTTFVSSIPNTAIIDFDDGANAVPGSRATRIHVRDYAHFDQVINKMVLDNTQGKRHWDRVAIDTIDELIAMIKHQLEEEKGVEDITEYRSTGYGYNMILQRFWSKILDLEQAGYSWAIVGHMRTIEETDPATKKPVTRIRESVYPGVAKKILTKSDFKLTVYCIPQTIERKVMKTLPDGRKIEVPAGTETRLVYYVDSMTTEARDGKQRGVPSMERKFELPLCGGWDVFKAKYDSAVAVERDKHS
jgi:hypothetical protein